MEQNGCDPRGAVIGYARTSTVDQQAGLDAQIEEMKKAGCTRIYSEQVSGVDAFRPELKAALDYARAGDVFMVTKPDRLARNVTHLLSVVEQLRAKGVTVRILSMHLDTQSATSMLTLSVLAAVACWEREAMLERQRHGIAAAKAAGKYRGRAPTARAKEADVLRLKGEGKKVSEIVSATGISRASYYRIVTG